MDCCRPQKPKEFEGGGNGSCANHTSTATAYIFSCNAAKAQLAAVLSGLAAHLLQLCCRPEGSIVSKQESKQAREPPEVRIA